MPFDALINGLRVWREIKAESSEGYLKRNAAIGCVVDAVIATKAYLYDRDIAGSSREVERFLSERWQKAAIAIEAYDRNLSRSAQIKALGWADPREWIRADGREYAIKLDTILEQCAYLRDDQRNHRY